MTTVETSVKRPWHFTITARETRVWEGRCLPDGAKMEAGWCITVCSQQCVDVCFVILQPSVALIFICCTYRSTTKRAIWAASTILCQKREQACTRMDTHSTHICPRYELPAKGMSTGPWKSICKPLKYYNFQGELRLCFNPESFSFPSDERQYWGENTARNWFENKSHSLLIYLTF
jgi:hypothetical protein